jgi:pimeloyl-ACP methyl ester carboxylesterase
MHTTPITNPHPTIPTPTTRLLGLEDGRTLAVDAVGPDDGDVVVFLHSAPGSRRFDPDPRVTAAAGVRLVTIDRAGYGASTPYPERHVPSVAGHADDTAEALHQLGLRDVAVAGWSAGGRVALALAARHPDLVRAVAIVGTPAPQDAVPWVPEEHLGMTEALRPDPASATAAITSAFASAGAPGEGALAMVSGGAADEAVTEDAERRARLLAMLDEAFRPGPVGVATDIVADQIVPWGFDVTAIGAPVTLFYGADDVAISPAHGRWYADRLAAAELVVVPDAGHLVVMRAWAAILGALA